MSEGDDHLIGVRANVAPALIHVSCILLTLALVVRLYKRGGPYWHRPATVMSHQPYTQDMCDSLVVMERLEPTLPKGAIVTCFRPVRGDIPSDIADLLYLVAIGQLPHQQVKPPSSALAGKAEWVIAIKDPLMSPRYYRVAAFPEGALYHQR